MNLRKIALMLAAACFLSAVPQKTVLAAERPEYLKSVTYFGDEWPVNYWGSEDKNIEENFRRICEDGFNSIILVVPWTEFQPLGGSGEFNQAAFDKLDAVTECAEKYGLWVVLRIGYTWDFYENAGRTNRFSGIVNAESPDRYYWLRYCEKIYDTVSVHENFHSGFITWEDFWNYVHNMKQDYPKETMIRMAKECGYQKYLKEHYALSDVEEWYEDTFHDFDEIYIPNRKQEAAALFFEFYDQFLMELSAQSQKVFPGLSLEVRADSDKIFRADGSTYYYSHKVTYPCDGAEYSALMYSVSMGQKNENDRITAEQALEGTGRTLGKVCEAAGKKLYAEQLLYMDSTEEFSYNTQIEETQVGDYVRALAPVLKENTMGYGLWVYRNYVNNGVYNGQFGFGTDNWNFKGGSTVKTVDGTQMAKIGGNKKISQNLDSRLAQGEKIFVKLYVKPTASLSELTVKMGDMEQKIKVDHEGSYELVFPWADRHSIELSANRDMYVDDIKVYTYEQYGRIYDTEGNALDLAEDFRMLNSELQ